MSIRERHAGAAFIPTEKWRGHKATAEDLAELPMAA